MIKATIASVLALAAAVSLAGCAKKDAAPAQQAAAPTASTAGSAATSEPTMPTGMQHPAAKPSADFKLSGIAKAEGGKTVAAVFAEKDALTGKTVAVRGKVVKVNGGIMNKDWLHLRDGSGAAGTDDLTVTTTSATLPKVGDTVVVSGTVVLNKDFGMGYQYPVMLEDATVTVEATGSK